MKTFAALSLALLFSLLSELRASAVVVSWSFNGVLNYVEDNSNAIPDTVTVGSGFTGTITYDTAGAPGDSTPSPNFGDYYFRTNSSFVISVQVGGVTFTSTNRSPSEVFASINVGNSPNTSYAQLTYEAADPVLINGATMAAGVAEGGINLSFQDDTKTAVASDAMPTVEPSLAAFSSASFTMNGFTANYEATVFYISGDITEISPFPKVILNATPLAGNQLRLSWPKASSGLTLQFATSLTTQDWTTEPTAVVDTATEHTVTVSSVGQPKFFRLVKLP